MTAAEFDRLTAWGPDRWAPSDWDGRSPYLLRDGVIIVFGRTIRAYLISDGTRLANAEDYSAVAAVLGPLFALVLADPAR